ncbi:haloacid dehalogenase type II [Prolixibacter sp. NT017]|uniref:haloacid dehalogenase type II n=1 Tax=Prolixibacter sp. NT017 TaxID=2652390 RepID=UPI00126C8AC3|nr:haloacid dehalogenase type II [Prolixibacter sp. NT017]GET24429.1 haloacid dehalogenase [Prolixibacter sp. NT017]
MATTLAFDVYGTLIDTHGISNLVHTFVGDKAISFMDSWRAKQLEYTFRRGLMKNYVDFSECNRNALDFTCEVLKCNLQPEERNRLMREYKVLPAFTDVRDSLEKLKSVNLRLFAFSNGSAADVNGLLGNAGILHFFEDVVSVDDVKTFKPNPAVYEHFLLKSKSSKTISWLISGNPFDVIGAISYGMNSVWIQRSPDAVFDTWGIKPTKTINGLLDLATVFNE